MFDLTGKGALVTGPRGGIGGAIAKALHAQGANVAISGTRRETLDELADRARRARRMCCLAIFATAPRSAKLAEEAEKAVGQVDILVNNAGITHDNLFMRMKDEEWDDVIDGQSHLGVRADARHPARHDAAALWAHHQYRLDRPACIGNPGQANYAASKAGLVGMTKSLAREVASRGITANCIAPGFISTPMTDALTPKQTEAIAAAIPAPSSASQRISRRRWSSSPARKPATSPARRCISTAAW